VNLIRFQTPDYQGTGLAGMKMGGKGSAFRLHSIFLPCDMSQ
jgi:hypothetical protein